MIYAAIFAGLAACFIGAKEIGRGHAQGDDGLSTFLAGSLTAFLGLLLTIVATLRALA